VTVVGNSGSGKSTLARRLAERFHLATLDLDAVVWEPGRVAVARDPGAAAADLEAFCGAGESWVVEGCYAALAGETLRHRPLLLFLEPGVEVCLDHCRRRPWEPHKYDSKSEQDARLAYLLGWVRDYYTRDGDLSLAAHQGLFDAYDGPKRKVVAPPGEDLMAEIARVAPPSGGGVR